MTQRVESDLSILKEFCEAKKSVSTLSSELLNLSPTTQSLMVKAALYVLETNSVRLQSDIKLRIKVRLVLQVLGNVSTLSVLFQPYPLYWVGNSCYLDSVLVGLLMVPTQFIDNTILNSDVVLAKNVSCEDNVQVRYRIQNELKLITSYLREGSPLKDMRKTCLDLRQILKGCPVEEQYWDSSPRDAGEFLTYLISMFPTDRDTIVKRITSVSNDGENFIDKEKTVERNHSVVIQLDVHVIDRYLSRKFKTMLLSVFCHTTTIDTFSAENLVKRNGFSYSMKKEVLRVEDSPYLIFKFDRVRRAGGSVVSFVSTSIIPDQNIYLPPVSVPFVRRLTLTAIVCWESGHYVCYFKLGLVWFLYNDTDESSRIKTIGGYIDMLKQKKWSIMSNGVLYFYTDTTGYGMI